MIGIRNVFLANSHKNNKVLVKFGVEILKINFNIKKF